MRRRRKDPGAFLQETIERFQPEVVYLSTLVLGRYLSAFQQDSTHKPIFITHVHELEITLNTMSDPQAVGRQVKLSSAIISCAQVVQDHITVAYAIKPQTSLHIVREYIPYNQFDELITAADPAAGAHNFLQRIQAAANEGRFIFGSNGQASSRKGFDLLPQLIQACHQTFQDRKFLALWIGAPEQGELCQFIDHTLQQAAQRILSIIELTPSER